MNDKREFSKLGLFGKGPLKLALAVKQGQFVAGLRWTDGSPFWAKLSIPISHIRLRLHPLKNFWRRVHSGPGVVAEMLHPGETNLRSAC